MAKQKYPAAPEWENNLTDSLIHELIDDLILLSSRLNHIMKMSTERDGRPNPYAKRCFKPVDETLGKLQEIRASRP